jgi:hypothetical protein
MKICLFDHHNNPYPIQGYGGIKRVNQLLFLTLCKFGLNQIFQVKTMKF